MRRPITKLLAVAAAVLLTTSACSAEGGDSAPAEDEMFIGVSFYSRTVPLYAQIEEGMRAKAEELGATLEFAYADNSAETQTNQIGTFVTKGVDLVLASPIDTEALVPAYTAARNAGVPVISVANKLADENEDAYVGPDLVEQSERTMERLIEGMGGSGEVLLLTGPPQIAFIQAQQEGWDRALARHTDVTVVESLVVADLSTSGAVDVATAGLSSHPEVDGILGSLDDISLGAVQAANDLQIDPESIVIGGWDGGPAAIEAIEAGSYDFTLSQRGYTWGEIAVQVAVDYLEGTPPSEHRVNSPDVFIDQENVTTLPESEMR